MLRCSVHDLRQRRRVPAELGAAQGARAASRDREPAGIRNRQPDCLLAQVEAEQPRVRLGQGVLSVRATVSRIRGVAMAPAITSNFAAAVTI